MSQSAVITCQPTGPIQQGERFQANITITDSGGGQVTLGSGQPQLFITGGTPPNNSSRTFGAIDPTRGNMVQTAGVANYNFDAVCHVNSGSSTYTVSAILYDNLGNSIPVTPATITVLPVK